MTGSAQSAARPPLTVVFLSASANTGGAERVLLDAVAGLVALSAAVPHVIVPGTGPVLDEARAAGAQVTVVALPQALAAVGDFGRRTPGALVRVALSLVTRLPALLWYARQLRAAVRRARPDVVHSNGLKMHLLSVLVVPSRTAIVWHLHDYIGQRAMASRLLRMARVRCAVAIANSEDVAADARSLFGASPPVEVLLNPVDLTRFTPTGPVLDLDAAAGMPAAPRDVIRVGLIATFARWKGHRTFLSAMARVARVHPVRGYVIGGAIYATEASQESVEALRAHACGEGLDGIIGFTGFLPDTASAMRALDVVVHASTRPEPFGLVIAEAMAVGRSVVTSASGGAAEIVRAEDTALTHTPGDADSLAMAIGRLCASTALRGEMGARARMDAITRFDREPFAAALAAIYHRLAA